MKPDSNVDAICVILRAREATGLIKYGCTTDRKDLSEVEWLTHLRDELLDAAIYTQKLISYAEQKPEGLRCSESGGRGIF